MFSAQELSIFDQVRDHLAGRGITEKISVRTPEYGLAKTDNQLIVDLVGQLAAIGNNKAQDKLRNSDEIKATLDWTLLRGLAPAQRKEQVWRALKAAGSRYAGKTLETCKYSGPLADSIDAFLASGGPATFVRQLAGLATDADRLSRVRALPALSGLKSPRDFLTTKLGMATSFVALDSRIMQTLSAIAPGWVKGSATPVREADYLKVETALVRQVCPRYGISGAELDQWLFHGNAGGELAAYVEGLR